MNKFIKIPAVVLGALVLALAVWPPPKHLPPVNPTSSILNVAVEGAGAYQISMWIPTGSTSDSVPGIAHVLEHLKFKNRDGSGLSGFGAIAGSASNAATSYRTTRYDLNVPPDGFDKAMQTLAEMTKPLQITEADVKLEKTVVAQELLQRTQSDPDTAFFQDYYSTLYAGTPYQGTPGGTQESVASVTLKDVLAFDDAHYKNTKLFLLIMGPALNSARAGSIEKYFPNSALGHLNIARKFKVTRDDAELLAAPVLLPSSSLPTLGVSEFAREKISPRAQTVKLTVSKLINAPTSWRSLAAAQILQSAMRSRLPEGLQDKISEDNRMVQNWSVSIGRLVDGVWQIEFNAAVEKNVVSRDVRLAFEDYFKALAKTGISQQSFERLKARNFLTNEWEQPEGRGASLSNDSIEFGYGKAVTFQDEMHLVELKDVNDLLRALNQPGRVGELQLKPAGAAQ